MTHPAPDVFDPAATAERLPAGRFVQLAATGHCPNLSAPEETVGAIRAFLAE